MNETTKIFKLIFIVFLIWLTVTYIPNDYLHKWWFLLLIFANFYFWAQFVRQKHEKDLFMNTAIYGLIVLGVVSVILNRILS